MTSLRRLTPDEMETVALALDSLADHALNNTRAQKLYDLADVFIDAAEADRRIYR